jgi:FAD binding domain-containing protein
MTTSDTIAVRDLETLRAAVTGDVFILGEAGYDQARQAWNLATDERPAVVVMAESAADVMQAVRFARTHGMRIAPQGTGHGAEPLEPLQGAMLLRTARMRSVRIDPAARTARADAGAVWQDVTVPAGEHGLAALAGTSPNVGVTGYTLGGGIGWLARRYGLAANSVTAAEIVTPGGRLVRTDAGHEPDLFWAVRGGGGSVGVVTALEMRLYPVRELYAGALFFPIGRAGQVLRAWRTWTGTVPDEVTSVGRILRLPPLPEVPEPLRGRAFALVEAAFMGDAGTGSELLGSLRRLGPELDTFAMIPAPALQQLHMDPELQLQLRQPVRPGFSPAGTAKQPLRRRRRGRCDRRAAHHRRRLRPGPGWRAGQGPCLGGSQLAVVRCRPGRCRLLLPLRSAWRAVNKTNTNKEQKMTGTLPAARTWASSAAAWPGADARAEEFPMSIPTLVEERTL